jgi:hypothetical protein
MREILRFVEQPRQCSYLPEETASLEVRCIADMSPAEPGSILHGVRTIYGRLAQQTLRHSSRWAWIANWQEYWKLLAAQHPVLPFHRYRPGQRQSLNLRGPLDCKPIAANIEDDPIADYIVSCGWLAAIDPDESTKEAIGDWHYGVSQGCVL